MKTYAAELEAARRMDAEHASRFPFFSDAQLAAIRGEARRLDQWVKQHVALHDALNTFVMASLLALDVMAILRLPILLAIAAHGYIMYGLTNMSLHEGAGHNGLIRGKGRLAALLRVAANNLCRLFFADPEFYRSRHVFHHAKFGTAEDGAFTNIVLPHRFLLCLLPLAGVMPFVDYKIHAGETYTKSRALSDASSVAYLGVLAAMIGVHEGDWQRSLFVLVLGGPWLAFVLDRLRETTEHQLMPTHAQNGARSFGPGLWGFLIGGGAWGQPCHLMHHLAPGLPWYMQLRLHGRVAGLMTEAQRRAFLLTPVVGYPMLLFRVLRQSARLTRAEART